MFSSKSPPEPVNEPLPRHNTHYQALLRSILAPFSALLTHFTHPSSSSSSSTPHKTKTSNSTTTTTTTTATAAALLNINTHIARPVLPIPSAIVEKIMECVIERIVLELDQRAEDALRALNARDPVIAKAERDEAKNRGKGKGMMECFLVDVEGVFGCLVGEYERRFPTKDRMGGDYLRAYNPFCSYDLFNPEICLTDTVDQPGGATIASLVNDSMVIMGPLIHASFQYLKARMTPPPTPNSTATAPPPPHTSNSNSTPKAKSPFLNILPSEEPEPENADIFSILDNLNLPGVSAAFESYGYFSTSERGSITPREFIDQVALSQIIWGVARLFGRDAVGALDRLQTNKNKYLLRYGGGEDGVKGGEFDLTDPMDERARKIKEGFVDGVRWRFW